jgi:hypothetical protein
MPVFLKVTLSGIRVHRGMGMRGRGSMIRLPARRQHVELYEAIVGVSFGWLYLTGILRKAVKTALSF